MTYINSFPKVLPWKSHSNQRPVFGRKTVKGFKSKDFPIFIDANQPLQYNNSLIQNTLLVFQHIHCLLCLFTITNAKQFWHLDFLC